jgi:hypothetical protein
VQFRGSSHIPKLRGEEPEAPSSSNPVSRSKVYATGHALSGLAALRLDMRLDFSGQQTLERRDEGAATSSRAGSDRRHN